MEKLRKKKDSSLLSFFPRKTTTQVVDLNGNEFVEVAKLAEKGVTLSIPTIEERNQLQEKKAQLASIMKLMKKLSSDCTSHDPEALLMKGKIAEDIQNQVKQDEEKIRQKDELVSKVKNTRDKCIRASIHFESIGDIDKFTTCQCILSATSKLLGNLDNDTSSSNSSSTVFETIQHSNDATIDTAYCFEIGKKHNEKRKERQIVESRKRTQARKGYHYNERSTFCTTISSLNKKGWKIATHEINFC